MAANNLKTPSKKTVIFLYDGLVALYPWTIFGEKKAEQIGIEESYAEMKSAGFALFAMNTTGTQTIENAAEEVLTWKKAYEKGEYPKATIPQNINELVESLDEIKEQKGKEAEKTRLAKEAILRSQIAKEKSQIKTEAVSPTPAEPSPQLPEGTPSPSATEEVPAGISLEVIKRVDINPIARGALKIATLPFFFAGPRVAATPEGQITASAQHLLFRQHITSTSFAGIRPKALSLGISPKEFDNLLKAIAEQERAYPGLFNRISSGFGIQEIIVRSGVPQSVAGKLFLTPSSEAGSLVIPRRGLLGGLLGRIGQQLFGGIFKGAVSKKAAVGALSKVATTIAKLEPHVRVAAWALTAVKAVVNFLKGKGDKEGVGGTLATVGFLAGGIILLPVAPFFAAVSFGAGALSGLGTLASRAGGYGNLGAQTAGFGQTMLTGLASVVAPAIGIPLLISLISIPLLVAIILLIINSGAYIVPPSPSQIPGAIESPYIGIEKTATPKELDTISGEEVVTYEVRIFAKKGTLSNIRIANEYKVISNQSPPVPKPVVAEIENPPQIISPVEDYVFEYQINLDARYNDSVVVDALTVQADAPEQKDATARISASVVIGNPPISCPLPGQSLDPRHGSYTPGVETGGHGSADYWQRMGGSACRYSLPQGAPSCSYTNDPRAREAGNPCYNANGCSTYGYAADVFGSPGQEVFLPTVDGKSVEWSYAGTFSNGNAGFSHKYSSGQYFLVLTHLTQDVNKGSGLSPGTVVGKLHPQGGNTHVHIEFAVGGRYVRPDDYFCF